jgi:hypothetical protein
MTWDVWRWKCCECGTRRGLHYWATHLYVCRLCAVKHHYPDFLPSLFTWAYGEDFNA